MMQNDEITNEQELDSLIEVIKAIYDDQSENISYADTYQSVYRLCKKGMQEELIKRICQVSGEISQIALKELQPLEDHHEGYVKKFKSIIHQLYEAIERIIQVLLYVETNYFYQCKRQHASIKDMLYGVLFEQLLKNRTILEKLAKIIALSHISGKIEYLRQQILIINELDSKELFLKEFLSEKYLAILCEHFSKMAHEKIQKITQKQYFIWARMVMQNEKVFLNENFKRKEGRKIIQEMMKKLFDVIVTQFKEVFYNKDPKILFEENTSQFLELLSEKEDEKQIVQYNDWFIDQIKKKVAEFDFKDNRKFLQKFLEVYEDVSKCLSTIKRFNIKYKAIFFFEQWVNQEKINLPKRINFYVEEHLIMQDLNEQKFLKNFYSLFKLLKEKDFFEKQFRQNQVKRKVYKNRQSNKLEEAVINLMVEDCGKEWGQKIVSLQRAEIQKNEGNFNAVVYEDNAWPFERQKQVALFNPQLQKFIGKFTVEFEETNKGKKLEWNRFIGSAILTIKFREGVQFFKTDTRTCNLLLFIQTLGFRTSLKDLLSSCEYTLEEVQETLSFLSKQKIVQLSQNNEKVQLCLQYSVSQKTVDLTTQFTEKSLQYSAQEELRADRKLMVEALIIKLIKTNKVLKMEDLYSKITPMIQSRGFHFNKGFVDNAFKSLVTKNFIRDLQDGTFSYIAS